jgi:hypothetical protein
VRAHLLADGCLSLKFSNTWPGGGGARREIPLRGKKRRCEGLSIQATGHFVSRPLPDHACRAQSAYSRSTMSALILAIDYRLPVGYQCRQLRAQLHPISWVWSRSPRAIRHTPYRACINNLCVCINHYTPYTTQTPAVPRAAAHQTPDRHQIATTRSTSSPEPERAGELRRTPCVLRYCKFSSPCR